MEGAKAWVSRELISDGSANICCILNDPPLCTVTLTNPECVILNKCRLCVIVWFLKGNVTLCPFWRAALICKFNTWILKWVYLSHCAYSWLSEWFNSLESQSPSMEILSLKCKPTLPSSNANNEKVCHCPEYRTYKVEVKSRQIFICSFICCVIWASSAVSCWSGRLHDPFKCWSVHFNPILLNRRVCVSSPPECACASWDK